MKYIFEEKCEKPDKFSYPFYTEDVTQRFFFLAANTGITLIQKDYAFAEIISRDLCLKKNFS